MPEEVSINKGWLISNNHSDANAGVHKGLLNIVFLQQVAEFSGMLGDFTNDDFATMAEQAKASGDELKSQVAATTLAADPGILPKTPKKRAGPPTSKNAKFIKIQVTPKS